MNQYQRKVSLEREIIQLLRQRDKQGVTLLYQNYAGALFGIISRIIQSQEIAEEVLQDVFLKIWDNFDKYDAEKGRLYTWLSQLTRNLALDKVRSASYRKKAITDGFDPALSRSEQLAESLYMEDSGLRKVVQSLDKNYSELIDYAYFKGYAQSEIAKELGIPLGTVKTRMRSAIKQLRRILQHELMILVLMILWC